MIIRKAIDIDAEPLTVLTMRSKAYWGFSSEQIEEWREVLTVTVDYLNETTAFKLLHNEELVGYYAYLYVEENVAKLDNLFIDPVFIGKGYGKVLMNHFIEKVKQEGAKQIRLDSEPKAEKFYAKFGFEVIGQLPTSIENRFLPIMEMSL